ncbi:MAG: D-alanine--D-alanine ligase family protein [Acidimicrobiales bacterium]
MPLPPAQDRIRLVVLFGGQSAEHDVSRTTASHVLRAADPDRYDILPVAIGRDGQWRLAESALEALAGGPDSLPDALSVAGPPIDPATALSLPPSPPATTPPTSPPAPIAATGHHLGWEPLVALPLLHGPFGEDGTVQGLLELAAVPYAGAGVLGSALAMDKAKAKEVFAYHGLPQAKWLAWRADQLPKDQLDVVGAELGFPCFVKPSNLGSSIGVSKVNRPAELAAAVELALSYDEWILVEEAIVGREIELAVLGNGDPQVSGAGEIVPGADFYDYEDKYLDGRAKLLIPAPIPDTLLARFQSLARQAFLACRAEGMARVDFFLEEVSGPNASPARGPLLNEVNTIPGFTPISMYPKLWQHHGLAYPELLDALVSLAIERHQRRRRRTDR